MAKKTLPEFTSGQKTTIDFVYTSVPTQGSAAVTIFKCPRGCGVAVLNIAEHEAWHKKELQKYNKTTSCIESITGVLKSMEVTITTLTRRLRSNAR